MELLVILILVIAASAIGTVTGFGLSTVMIPVLALFYPVPETLLFVGVVHWFNDLWKLVLFREGIRWKLILRFGLPGIVATLIGAHLLLAIPSTALERVLGVFLIGYVVFLFARSAFKIRQSTAAAITGGALSGFFAGVFGMGGAIRALFLSAFDLPKAVYLATAGRHRHSDRHAPAGHLYRARDPARLFAFLGHDPVRPGFLPGRPVRQRTLGENPAGAFPQIVAAFLFIVGLRLLIRPG